MDQLYWPLSVLSRSIHYRNLTGASQHVGLSQPQLSRIIKGLEQDLGITLLDRKSPRHSSWTPEARRLAEIFLNSEKALSVSLQAFTEESEPKEVRIGCLEGLSQIAREYSYSLFENTSVSTIYLNIYDLNHLESKFLSTDLDLIFSSRGPGLKKYNFIKTLGYQVLEKKKTKYDLNILSPFEYRSSKVKDKQKKLISNSMQLRKAFYETYGGIASFPTEVMKSSSNKDAVPVVAVAQDHFSDRLWGYT